MQKKCHLHPHTFLAAIFQVNRSKPVAHDVSAVVIWTAY